MNPTPLTTPHQTSSAKWMVRAAVSAYAAMTLASALFAQDIGSTIKVGIVGLDAHAVPWTKIIHGWGAADDSRCLLEEFEGLHCVRGMCDRGSR